MPWRERNSIFPGRDGFHLFAIVKFSSIIQSLSLTLTLRITSFTNVWTVKTISMDQIAGPYLVCTWKRPKRKIRKVLVMVNMRLLVTCASLNVTQEMTSKLISNLSMKKRVVNLLIALCAEISRLHQSQNWSIIWNPIISVLIVTRTFKDHAVLEIWKDTCGGLIWIRHTGYIISKCTKNNG